RRIVGQSSVATISKPSSINCARIIARGCHSAARNTISSGGDATTTVLCGHMARARLLWLRRQQECRPQNRTKLGAVVKTIVALFGETAIEHGLQCPQVRKIRRNEYVVAKNGGGG